MYHIWCQSVEQFDRFSRHLNLWTPKTPQNAPCGIVGRLVFNLCPFPDESADVNQSWCKSIQPFDSFSRLLNLWLPKPQNAPWDIEGRVVFSLCPLPDESADVYQIWSRLVQLFDSFPILLNLWPPKPPGVLRGELYLAHVHSQTNPHICTKFGSNRSSCLTASPNIWICDPLKSPEMPMRYCGANCI